MTAQTALVGLILALMVGSASAEPPPGEDDVSRAYYQALDELRAGEDRQDIGKRLKPVVDKNSESWYLNLARPLVVDLGASAKNRPEKGDDLPEERLGDTRIPFYVLQNAENWGYLSEVFAEQEPKDPVSQLVAADRTIIARLIPLLDDRSPARCNNPIVTTLDWSQPQARVCDLALALIEYHGKVLFYYDGRHSFYLHQLPEEKRAKVADDVASWWEKVKDKPVAAGIRIRIEQQQSEGGKVWMAKTLAQLTAGQQTDDREFALNFLRAMVKQNYPHTGGIYAAKALEEIGDTSAVDIFYAECKSWLEQPRESSATSAPYYLCKHGGRREWELLYALSLLEVDEGKKRGTGVAMACVLKYRMANTNPYAIPILGLALGQTGYAGRRSVVDGSHSFSHAEQACELLQKRTAQDFGYQRNEKLEVRLRAVKQAQAWWDSEGKTKYNFDTIEKELITKDDSPSQPKK